MAPAVRLGYKLSSEEHGPQDLVRQARLAEDSGFTFGLISDHFHPWIDRQGQSPFVWSVIGAIAAITRSLELGTAVACPTMRIHPALVAQAAATCAMLMEGRFFLGLGTGENLNEHIVGAGWPETAVRQERLEEAVQVIRLLWEGGYRSHHGRHFTVENARIYSRPDTPPRLLLAVGGGKGAELAARVADGMIGTSPSRELIDRYQRAGGAGRPRYGELTVCWHESEAAARRLAREVWPNAAMPSSLAWELPLPAHFEAMTELVTEDAVADSVVCGPDPDRHLAAIAEYGAAGYDHVCIHQVGPDQAGFMRFYASEIMPRLQAARETAA